MSEALKVKPQLPVEDKRKFHPQNFVHTSLFSEVYIFNDLPIQLNGIWDRIEDRGRFDEFFTHLVTLMSSFSPVEAYKWNHTETLKNLIYPMLEILGYGDFESSHHAFLDNHQISFINSEGNQIDLKPSVLICEDESGKNYIKKSTKGNIKSELEKYLKLPIVTSYYGATFDRKSAKYNIMKDELGKRGDVYTNLGPNDHAIEYLNILGTTWGIFTDGAIWRLYRKDASTTDSEKYYEFDFSELYNLYRTSKDDASDEHSEFFEVAKYFFWFFSFESLVKGFSVVPFAESVYQKSQVYVDKIEEDLKERFVHAMTITCNGFLETLRKKNALEDIRLIAKTSESLIFNIIFIRSCESRRVLPLHQDYLHVSLKVLIDKIKHFSSSDAYEVSERLVKQNLNDIFNKIISDDGTEIYDHIQKLHSIVDKGDNGFGITGFVESVFYPDEMLFYKKYKIKNCEMLKMLFHLFYNFNEGKNVQIPYNLITPRQLGSVYESFLEFQPEISTEKLYYVRKKLKNKTYWQWVNKSELPAGKNLFFPSVDKNDVIFTPNNKERKTTGSYYTPEYMVNHIVKETIGPLCIGKTASEILKIKVCDPAMGSGHFLLGAIDFLSRKIVEKDKNVSIMEIKKKLIESCIYGVDSNPSAVKLGKMSLWLATATAGKKLCKLDNHLCCNDSLSSEWKSKFMFTKDESFDALIGNPPWGAKEFDYTSIDNSLIKLVDIKNVNSFELFTFRCILEPKLKTFGFLIPRNVLRKWQYSNLRKHLLPNLNKIIDVGVFPGVLQEACAVIASNIVSSENIVFDYSIKKDNKESSENIINKKLVTAPYFLFAPDSDAVLENIVSKMEKGKKLSDIFEITRGISCSKTGIFSKCSCGTLTNPPKKKNSYGKYEKTCKDCSKLITLKTETTKVISDKQENKKYSPIVAGPDISSDKLHINKWILTGLEDINYKDDVFESKEKIFVKRNSDKIVGKVVTTKILATETVYILNPKIKLDLDTISKYLNSRLMTFYYEYRFNLGGALTNSITNENLSSLIIPDLIMSNCAREFTDALGLSQSDLNRVEEYLILHCTETKQDAA